MEFRRGPAAVLLLVAALLSGCGVSRQERSLAPDDAEFLTKVRYLITPAERKAFLALPPSERSAFRSDFWRRRDPTPDTEANEFRDEYFRRIAQSDRLFHGEGRPGWMTDRGRIYVLFGPPAERQTFPMERRCQEIWFYGAFPVVFEDQDCTGNFVLVAVNLDHLHELNRAQHEAIREQAPRTSAKPGLELGLRVEEPRADAPGAVELSIPYDSVWFELKGSRMEAAFEVRLELLDAAKKVVWEHRERVPLAVDPSELKGYRDRTLPIRIPFPYEAVAAPGPLTLRAVVTSGAEVVERTTVVRGAR